MLSKQVSEWFARYRIYFSKVIGIALLAIFLLSQPVWFHKSYAWSLNLTLQSIGLIFVTICLLGRLWAALYLCGNKTFNLITQGPYSIVRNPLYFFTFIGITGVGLTSGSIILTTLLIFLFFATYYPTIIDEEKTLERYHQESEEFKNYMSKIPRIIPDFSLHQEPEMFNLNTYGFRRTILDVMWFMWVYLIIVIIGTLHFHSVLPTLFKIF